MFINSSMFKSSMSIILPHSQHFYNYNISSVLYIKGEHTVVGRACAILPYSCLGLLCIQHTKFSKSVINLVDISVDSPNVANDVCHVSFFPINTRGRSLPLHIKRACEHGESVQCCNRTTNPDFLAVFVFYPFYGQNSQLS